jgi:hypothetical protein
MKTLFARLTELCLASLALFIGVEAPAQTQRTVGDCSPVLTHVTVGQVITFNCDLGRLELRRFAQDLTRLVESQRLTTEQTAALLKALNDLFPSVLKQLERLEGKQDKALQGLSELLRRTVNSQTPPDAIEAEIASQRGKFLPGFGLSECGCHGKPDSDDEDYGSIRTTIECVGGREQIVACQMESGSNVCTNFLTRLGMESGYAPWMRVCL